MKINDIVKMCTLVMAVMLSVVLIVTDISSDKNMSLSSDRCDGLVTVLESGSLNNLDGL